MSTAIQPVQPVQLPQQYVEPKPLTVADVRRQIGVIQTVMKEVMKKDVHYGVVPGTQQQSLLKPGAEKIAATFRLAPDYTVEDLSTGDEARYRVTCRLASASGVFVGSGLGEASTNEQKYKWRAAICKEEYEATDESRRRMKYARAKGGGFYTQQQVRQDPADLANTVLKMSAKRALVAAVLTATAASDIFAQDLEDLPPEVRDELMGDYGDGETAPSKKATPQRQQATRQQKAPPRQPVARSETQQEQAPANDNGEFIRDNQVKQINSKCDAMGVDVAGLIKAFGVETLNQIPAAKMRDVLAWIDGEAS